MTYPAYDHDRERIIDFLTEHGWSVTETGEMVDAADIEYESEKGFRLHIDHNRPEKAWFNLTVEGDGREVTLLVEFGPRLNEVLAAIVAHQDALEWNAMTAFMDDLYEAAEEVYLYQNDEPVPLPVAIDGPLPPSVRIARILERAGWSPSAGSSPDKADFTFHGSALGIEVIQAEPDDAPSSKQAAFVILGRNPPRGAALVVYPGDELHRLLKVLVRYQDSLTASTVAELVGEICLRFPRTYAVVDEQPVQVRPELLAHLVEQATE